MGSFTRSLPFVCLGMLPAFAGGCSGIGSGVTTGSTDAQSAKLAASGVSQPLTRAVEVATTAACARAYGYSLDPVRLRETYLNYENRQGASREQLRVVEQSYDATYQQVSGSNYPSAGCPAN
jgi:hypothetical protein